MSTFANLHYPDCARRHRIAVMLPSHSTTFQLLGDAPAPLVSTIAYSRGFTGSLSGALATLPSSNAV
eukprot:8645377-Pyramimonas_sp.AAC.1